MKRVGNLYEEICSLENLKLADEKARKGKLRSFGLMLHDQRREANILALQKMLIDKTYRTSTYQIFKIYEPKEREIYRLPYFPDRIMHHAVLNVLEKIWVSIFTNDTYSCIKGKGIHAAVTNLKRTLRENPTETVYCLKIDVRKFYPSVDHDILKALLRRKLKDEKLLKLLDEVIDSAVGIPIGNYLSQFFANLYLAYFDHWVKEKLKVKFYYRYADDMVFFNGSKQELHDILSEIKTYLKDHLRLQLKGNYQIFPVEARSVDFVGYKFYHTHTLLRKGVKKQFCQRAARINKRNNLTFTQYKKEICSWIGWAKHCNSINLMKKIIKRQYYEAIRRV